MPKDGHTDSVNLNLNEVHIKHIGPVTQKALEKEGIRTVANLAGSTVAEIESILKLEAHVSPDTERISKWIQKAKKIVSDQQKNIAQSVVASTENQPAKVSGEHVNKPEWQKYEEFAVYVQYGHGDDGQRRWRAIILQHAGSDEPSKWQSNDGAYIVKFEHQSSEDGQRHWRTRLVHAETETEIVDFTGKTPDKWWPRIVKKASLPQEASQASVQEDKDIGLMPTSDNAEPQAVGESEAEKALRITHFEVHLPSDNRPNTLVADVDFEISDKILAQQSLQFQVEVLYVNLENNVSHLAGYTSEQLISEKREYECQVEFPMPELGCYQPHCVVLSLPSGEHGDYYKEDRILKIVPKK